MARGEKEKTTDETLQRIAFVEGQVQGKRDAIDDCHQSYEQESELRRASGLYKEDALEEHLRQIDGLHAELDALEDELQWLQFLGEGERQAEADLGSELYRLPEDERQSLRETGLLLSGEPLTIQDVGAIDADTSRALLAVLAPREGGAGMYLKDWQASPAASTLKTLFQTRAVTLATPRWAAYAQFMQQLRAESKAEADALRREAAARDQRQAA